MTATRVAGSGALQGTTTATASAGIVSFVNLSHNVATNITIQFASGGLSSATSTTIAISPAAAARLTIQTQPSSSATAGVTFAQQPVLRVEDGFGNLIVSDSSTVVSASRNGGAGTLQGTLTATAVNGLIAFTDLSHKVANTITIDFSAPGLSGVTSANLLVGSGPFVGLQLLAPGEASAPATIAGKTGSPNAQVAGAPFNVTVNAVDAYWNVVTNVTDSISITSSDSNAALPANAAMVGGVKSFGVTLKTAGSASVSASDVTHPAKAG